MTNDRATPLTPLSLLRSAQADALMTPTEREKRETLLPYIFDDLFRSFNSRLPAGSSGIKMEVRLPVAGYAVMQHDVTASIAYYVFGLPSVCVEGKTSTGEDCFNFTTLNNAFRVVRDEKL